MAFFGGRPVTKWENDRWKARQTVCHLSSCLGLSQTHHDNQAGIGLMIPALNSNPAMLNTTDSPDR